MTRKSSQQTVLAKISSPLPEESDPPAETPNSSNSSFPLEKTPSKNLLSNLGVLDLVTSECGLTLEGRIKIDNIVLKVGLVRRRDEGLGRNFYELWIVE